MEKHNDPYYKRAKSEEYRSRASFKLKQLDKKYKIIKEGDTVIVTGSSAIGVGSTDMLQIITIK